MVAERVGEATMLLTDMPHCQMRLEIRDVQERHRLWG